MSHSTTRRRGRTRRARRASRIGSPPLRRASRSVRRRSGRLPSRAGRYLRVRRGGTARVISRMSVTSWRSSAGDSSVKSRPRSRSAAEATWRRAGPSASGSSPSSADEPFAETCIPADQPSGSPWDRAAGGGPPSGSARGRGGTGRQQIADRRGAAEQRGEHPVERAHLARVRHHRGQSTGAELGHGGGAHDRHGPGQPLAPVGADRQPRGVQSDPEARRHRGHIRRGLHLCRLTQGSRSPPPTRPGAPFPRLRGTSAPCSGSGRPPGRPARWRRRRSARRPS